MKYVPAPLATGLLGCLLLTSACGTKKDATAEAAAAPPEAVPEYAVLKLAPTTAELHSDYPTVLEGQSNVEIRPKLDGFIDQVLLARPPGPIPRGTLESQPPAPTLQTGVPAQLLRYRPDVQQAEYAYRSAFALTNAARSYFYPALTLTATGGYSTFEPKDLLNPASVFYSFIGGVLQPILNQGLNKARLRVNQAQQQEAQLNFQTALLTGGQEVSNALYSYQAAGEKVVEHTQQLDALRKSVSYSQALLKNGFANYTEVLTAQQNLLAAQLSGVNDRQQQLQAVTTLYRALGGGWQ